MKSDLHRILSARSIAIIGASKDPSKRGNQAIKQLVADEYDGPIYPINPKEETILGFKVYPSILDVEGPIDVVLVCTPARTLPGILEQCGKKGVPGAVVLAAGFTEEIAEASFKAARDNKVRVIGPNTNGAFNLHNKMNLVGVKGAEAGGIGITSQSGNMSLALITEAQRRGGLGFSTYVGVGNQMDVRFNEYLQYFGEDENTKTALFYIEGFKNGRKFLETCREVTQKKPVVIYKSGRTTAGQSAASSHTGSLAGSFSLTRDLLRQAGATVIEESDRILAVAEGLSKSPLPRGDRVAILADGGGHATITTDVLTESGLTLATLSDQTRTRLEAALPPAASLANPVDVAGGTDDNPACFYDCARAILEDPGVDILMIVGMFGGYAVRFNEEMLEAEIETSGRIADLVSEIGKPIIVQSVYAALRAKPLEVLKERGVPLFVWAEAAVRCVTELVRYACARERNTTSPRIEPGPPSEAARGIVAKAQREGRNSLYEYEAKDLLASYGVSVPPHLMARGEGDLLRVASDIGDVPVAMKIVSQDILHKSDAGGVKLKVQGEAGLKENYERILANAHAYKADARIDGVLVSPMARSGVEVIIGVTHDPIFGPVLMFGLGGIFVEVLKDVSFRALPLSKADIHEMVEGIQAKKILDGVRGAPPVDKAALENLILKVSTLALSHPEITKIDLNPVIVRSDGYDVVDARMIFTSEAEH